MTLRFAILPLLSFLCSGLSAQLPRVTGPDKQSPFRINKLAVDVQIMGNRSVTTYSMTFHNPTGRDLQATFELPLPEGVTVSRYALDINGIMREGVPVEKQRASEVFESIKKRGIDPGLLERTEGNIFRTTIYPVNAGKSRSIIIAFEHELILQGNNEMLYHLPLSSTGVIEEFSLSARVEQSANIIEAVIESAPFNNYTFIRGEGYYHAYAKSERMTVNQPLDIRISATEKGPGVYVQNKDGDQYFYTEILMPRVRRKKQLPKKLAVIWDNSLSGLYRNREKEIALLETYLRRCSNVTVELFTLNNTLTSSKVYHVVNGDTRQVTEHLKTLAYDGGTDFARIRFSAADETLLFTDGLSSLSTYSGAVSPHIVYTICTSPKANYDVLRDVAETNGGAFINLSATSIDAAVEILSNQSLRFLGVKRSSNILDYYPSKPTVVNNGFSLAGRFKNRQGNMLLQFGYGKTVVFERLINLRSDQHNTYSWDLSRVFAGKQIHELEKAYEQNKDKILALGKKHRLVTRSTSLLVLERVEDYIKYNIEPPAEVLEEYNELMEERKEVITETRKETLEYAIETADILWEWWKTSFPVKEKKHEKKPTSYNQFTVPAIADANTGTISLDSMRISKMELQEATSFGELLEGKVAGVQVDEVVVVGFSQSRSMTITRSGNLFNSLIVVDGKIADSLPAKEQIKSTSFLEPKAAVEVFGARAIHGVILVTTNTAKEEVDDEPEILTAQQSSTAEYIQALSLAAPEKQYPLYLELREKHLLDPDFYYDVACFFLKQDKALGLRILSNLGELDYENHELYKLFGFKLKELGEVEMQQFIFKKVLLSRPQEPQSYRDYALALADGGNYQAALDTLYLALTHEYDEDIMDNYEGIEETIIMEMNNLISRSNGELNTSHIHRKLLRRMPVDIRVVVNWNMNDTDLDLWITDPTGEKCYYENDETKIGGLISEDFMSGYGPEQFLLKKAVKGKYKIEVHYYGDESVKIAGQTTLMAEIFTNYGRANQHRKIIALQLDKEEKEGVYVGEFSF